MLNEQAMEMIKYYALQQKLQLQLNLQLQTRQKYITDNKECMNLKAHLLSINNEMLMDIGSATFINVRINDKNEIFVNIGLGFHLKMTRDEALEYIEARITKNNSKIENWSLLVAKTRLEIQNSVNL